MQQIIYSLFHYIYDHKDVYFNLNIEEPSENVSLPRLKWFLGKKSLEKLLHRLKYFQHHFQCV